MSSWSLVVPEPQAIRSGDEVDGETLGSASLAGSDVDSLHQPNCNTSTSTLLRVPARCFSATHFPSELSSNKSTAAAHKTSGQHKRSRRPEWGSSILSAAPQSRCPSLELVSVQAHDILNTANHASDMLFNGEGEAFNVCTGVSVDGTSSR